MRMFAPNVPTEVHDNIEEVKIIATLIKGVFGVGVVSYFQ